MSGILRFQRSQRSWLIACAVLTLALAALVYLVDRPAHSALLLPAALQASHPLGWFGPLGGNLPAFAHAFAFALLTAAFAQGTRRAAWRACLLWWAIGSALELGQAAAHASPATALPLALPAWFASGTFDPLDLAAVALGAAAAWLLLERSGDGTRARWPAYRPRLARHALIGGGLVLALGSGGGSGGSATGPVIPPACSGQIGLDTPTYRDTWQTDRATVDLGGYAPTPGGSTRTVCSGFDPGYVITWTNEANGATGSGGAWSRRSGSLLNLCVTNWYAPGIPLAPGANRIVVAAGALGGACITVTRVADTTPPAVVSVNPSNGALNVAPNTLVQIAFSEPMDAVTVNAATFTLTDPQGRPVAGTVRMDSATSATFAPATLLASQAPTDAGAYAARVSTGMRDAGGGNPLAADHVWSFRVGPAADTTPPAVAALEPAPDSACAGTQASIGATFDEPIDAASVSATALRLQDSGGSAVPGTVGLASPLTVRLEPGAPLAASASYSATLARGLRDLAGNALAADVRWSFATGAEYGAWQRTAAAGAPSPRAFHAAVWTGTAMIVAGGAYPQTNTGARYDPATDRWSPIADAPFLLAAVDQAGVWTGTEMIVYGGPVPMLAYNPLTNAWRIASTTSAPVGRSGYSVVWTGTEMIVWGGVNSNGARLMSGARYRPATDTWRATTMNGAPAAREQHTAVWTGREMIVWGGLLDGAQPTATGARYDPATDTWTPLTETGAAAARHGHTAVWAGDTMVVWGAIEGGGRYVPAADAWRPMSMLCAPVTRRALRAVTDGARMFVFGGASDGNLVAYANGALYDPAADRWQAMTAAAAPSKRYGHSMVWSGSRLIVWGGIDGGLMDTGGAFSP